MAHPRTLPTAERFDDEDFIFVGGPSHATDVLARRLCAHPRLWCGPERYLVPVMADLNRRWRQAIREPLAQAGVDGAALDEAARAWLVTFLRAGVPADRRVADRSAGELAHMGWLGSLFPRARFVHLVGGAQVDEVRRQAVYVQGRYLELDSAEFLSMPEVSMSRLLTFLGEPWDDAVLDGPRWPARRTRVGYEDHP